MLGAGRRQKNFFDVCGRCRINCCCDARPPITFKRKEIIEAYLKTHKIPIEDPFVQKEYTFPREDEGGCCIFYDKASRKCLIHPVKPETCMAGPVTFDINKENQKIEWYLKTEGICPLAGILFKNKNLFERHFESAKKELLRLMRELDSEALKAILKREEPDTFKIGEDEIEKDVLVKL
jgi:Fe-S-cluster containining protein